MNAQNGSVKSNIARLLAAACLMLVLGSLAIAQTMDPCKIYPKQSAYMPSATGTQKIISGALGKQIYICSIETTQTAATPALTLSYGVQVAATPCATGSPYTGAAGIGVLGVYGNPDTQFIGGSDTIAGPVPAAAASPAIDVCGVSAGAGFVGATVTYVQVP